MDTHGPRKALVKCEEELRKLAAEAAGKGDYDTLARLGTTARAVSELAREWGPTSPDAGNSSIVVTDPSQPKSVENTASELNRPRGRPGRPSSQAYPRFGRRGDEVVKIGWSKRDRREYQHRAGYNVLRALSRALLDTSKHRRLFTMEALDRVLIADKVVVPGYQGYVWLAWLRGAGLVKQHGRQGYSVLKPTTFEKDVERLWAAVPVQEAE